MHSELDKKKDQTPKRKAREQTEERLTRKQTEKRKEMHAKVNKVRDQTAKRKDMHSLIDKERDLTPKRRKMHQDIDKRRDQTEERIYYKKTKNSLRYQKKLLETFYTDTGFDVICASCLQYRNLEYCNPVSILRREKQKQFIVKYCALLKNRSEDQHVCNLCLKDIGSNKVLKRSNKNKFKFANFPKYFLEKLKKICKVKERNSSTNSPLDQENHERQVLQLNRLEAYLLKLIIPFIRIAHCPRGSYFKVKGELILI